MNYYEIFVSTFAPQAKRIRISSRGTIRMMESASSLWRGFVMHSVGILPKNYIELEEKRWFPQPWSKIIIKLDYFQKVIRREQLWILHLPTNRFASHFNENLENATLFWYLGKNQKNINHKRLYRKTHIKQKIS